MKKYIGLTILFIAALLPLIRLSEDGPSSILIFSVFAFFVLWKGLRHLLARIPIPLAGYYIVLGTLFGGLTQYFVQLEGFEKSFSGDPINHFFQALTIYFWDVVMWYGILRKNRFSVWGVYWVTGIWGVLVEGVVLYHALNPLIWLFLFVVYGSFAAIPYLILQERFTSGDVPKPKIYFYIFGLLIVALGLTQLTIMLMSLFGIK
jgi:hypothetical protein